MVDPAARGWCEPGPRDATAARRCAGISTASRCSTASTPSRVSCAACTPTTRSTDRVVVACSSSSRRGSGVSARTAGGEYVDALVGGLASRVLVTAGQWRRGDERRVRLEQRVRLGDVTPRRRLRLDAVARYLQDVASDDGDDADLPAGRGWILRSRRSRRRPAPEPGRERDVRDALHRTRAGLALGRAHDRHRRRGGHRTAVTSRAIWVYVDLTTRCAPRLAGRVLRGVRRRRAGAPGAALASPCPSSIPGPTRAPWPLRRTDIDVYQHVNNANYWARGGGVARGPGRRAVGSSARRSSSEQVSRPDDRLRRRDACRRRRRPRFWFGVDGERPRASRVVLSDAPRRPAR